MPLQLVASFGIKVGDKKRKREGKTLSAIRFGIMTFTSYGDAEVKRGRKDSQVSTIHCAGQGNNGMFTPGVRA